MVRQESYHRMLARVVVKSDHGFRGDRVLHYYDFIDVSTIRRRRLYLRPVRGVPNRRGVGWELYLRGG